VFYILAAALALAANEKDFTLQKLVYSSVLYCPSCRISSLMHFIVWIINAGLIILVCWVGDVSK
jgi:hypothetical protein